MAKLGEPTVCGRWIERAASQMGATATELRDQAGRLKSLQAQRSLGDQHILDYAINRMEAMAAYLEADLKPF